MLVKSSDLDITEMYPSKVMSGTYRGTDWKVEPCSPAQPWSQGRQYIGSAVIHSRKHTESSYSSELRAEQLKNYSRVRPQVQLEIDLLQVTVCQWYRSDIVTMVTSAPQNRYRNLKMVNSLESCKDSIPTISALNQAYVLCKHRWQAAQDAIGPGCNSNHAMMPWFCPPMMLWHSKQLKFLNLSARTQSAEICWARPSSIKTQI